MGRPRQRKRATPGMRILPSAFMVAALLACTDREAVSAAIANAPDLPDAPGAYRLVLVHGDTGDNAQQKEIRDRIEARVLPRLEALFPSVSYVSTADVSPGRENVAAACKQNKTIGLIGVSEDWNYTAGASGSTAQQLNVQLGVGVYECTFNPLLNAQKTKSVSVASSTDTDALVAAFEALTQRIVSQFQSRISLDPSLTENFLRFGYPIGDGERRTFLALEPAPGGAVVSFAAPYGTAARAGLREGVMVTALDGHPLAGLDLSALQAIQIGLSAIADSITATLLNPDGTSTTVDFEPEDLRWYVSHPYTGN